MRSVEFNSNIMNLSVILHIIGSYKKFLEIAEKVYLKFYIFYNICIFITGSFNT